VTGQGSHIKAMGVRDMTLFTVSAILLLDTLAATAAIGVSSLFWWIFLGLIFFLPYGLICAEMGTTYPEQGGIYAWVRDAFGRRWAARVTWFYWINAAIWFPSIFVLFAVVFSQMFAPEMSLFEQVILGIGLTWIVVFITCLTLDIGKWVPNLGALLKIIIFSVIIFGGFNLIFNSAPLANEFSYDSVMPRWDSSAQYIGAVIYGMLGFELVSAGSDEIHDPARNVPKSILVSGVIIISFYIFGTFAILAAIPAGDINLVEGLIDTLRILLGNSEAGVMLATILGIAALYTFVSNGTTWSIGCSRTMAEAAIEGEMPSFLGKEHKKFGTPVGAAVGLGVISTTVFVVYGLLAGSNEDLFWSLFACSAVLFLLPYIGLLLAFAKMRIVDADRARPYKVPGGLPVALFFTLICMAVLSIAIFLFIYVPGAGVDWPVAIGSVVAMILGEMAIRHSERESAAIQAAPS